MTGAERCACLCLFVAVATTIHLSAGQIAADFGFFNINCTRFGESPCCIGLTALELLLSLDDPVQLCINVTSENRTVMASVSLSPLGTLLEVTLNNRTVCADIATGLVKNICANLSMPSPGRLCVNISIESIFSVFGPIRFPICHSKHVHHMLYRHKG